MLWHGDARIPLSHADGEHSDLAKTLLSLLIFLQMVHHVTWGRAKVSPLAFSPILACPGFGTVPATRKKINSIPAETRTFCLLPLGA